MYARPPPNCLGPGGRGRGPGRGPGRGRNTFQPPARLPTAQQALNKLRQLRQQGRAKTPIVN